MAEDAGARATGGIRNSTHSRAVDVRNAVKLRDGFVDERVICREQIDEAAIFRADRIEQQFRFFPERLAQCLVRFRIHDRIMVHVFDID